MSSTLVCHRWQQRNKKGTHANKQEGPQAFVTGHRQLAITVWLSLSDYLKTITIDILGLQGQTLISRSFFSHFLTYTYDTSLCKCMWSRFFRQNRSYMATAAVWLMDAGMRAVRTRLMSMPLPWVIVKPIMLLSGNAGFSRQTHKERTKIYFKKPLIVAHTKELSIYNCRFVSSTSKIT